MEGHRQARPRTLAAFGVSMALLPSAGIADGAETQATVRVTIERASCGVSPRAVTAGNVVFRIANRSGRPAAFVIVNRRASVPPGGERRLRVSVKPSAAAYSCHVAGRRVARGAIRVSAPPEPSAQHRIGVRQADGFGEFFDRTTNTNFVPRGHEYANLGPQQDTDGKSFTYFTSFNVGRYDGDRMEATLARMAADGYNVITVALNGQCATECAVVPGGRLRAAYFANVADFLRRARTHGVYVMFGTQFFANGSAYANLINAEPRDLVDNVNLIPLTQGGIRAYSEFWTDVVRELRRHNAPLDVIFAYEVWDELSFDSRYKPFTLSSGTFRAPNGRAYNLAREDDIRQLMDDSLVHWVDETRKAIRLVDPTALVTIAFFEPQEPNRSRVGDTRMLSTKGTIYQSSADFVDIHPYPGVELTLPQYMQNFGISGPTPKPVVIGEFGAFKFAYPSPDAAVPALLAWQRDSCRYGVDGWLLWTWDTQEQPELWNALSDGGVIERALAPNNRPDPCA